MQATFVRSFLVHLLLLPLIKCDICPGGYTQAPWGWDCFQAMDFYESWIQQYFPRSFDEAEKECNTRYGGLLASIHSQEENDWANNWRLGCESELFRNIGLKCKGKECKWDDGSPITYTNFAGDGPKDDGVSRCFGIGGDVLGLWEERGCGKQQQDCWICRVKAKTIECSESETEYKGGCISVHSTPLDQQSAEAACPGGGHLVSIHSAIDPVTENVLYVKTALEAGINGTIYIGGHFSKGEFEWTDGSYYGMSNWANGFPKLVLGSCVQMLLASEFGVQGQWTNVDCTTKQAYMCFRDGANYDPNTSPPHPKAGPDCPYMQQFPYSGTVYSPNYPLSIPSQLSCTYMLMSDFGKISSVKFTTYDCQSGTSLTLIDNVKNTVIATFNSTPPPLNQLFYASSYQLKIVFNTSQTSEPVGTGWEAVFPDS